MIRDTSDEKEIPNVSTNIGNKDKSLPLIIDDLGFESHTHAPMLMTIGIASWATANSIVRDRLEI